MSDEVTPGPKALDRAVPGLSFPVGISSSRLKRQSAQRHANAPL
jgi:hypothetical protein